MADTVRPDFSSVYVLDAHFQYKDGVVDVFNSPAGRAVISECSPKFRSPVFKTTKRPSNPEVTKLLLNQDSFKTGDRENGNIFAKTKYDGQVIVYEEDESKQGCVKSQKNFNCWQNDIDSNLLEDRLSDDLSKKVNTDDSINNNGLTRRLVTFKNADEKAEKLATLEDLEEDIRINEKILRLKNHYERGFVADEKCDILKRMLTGFLSGWIFAKNSRSGGKWRKRKSSDDLYREASMALGIPCEMTDSCRCLDCQCNYFDCGDSDSDDSETSINLNECDVEEWPCPDEVINDSPSDKTFDIFHYEDEVRQKITELPSPTSITTEIETPTIEIPTTSSSTFVETTESTCNHTVIVVEETETVTTTPTATAAICQNGVGEQYKPTLEMAAGGPLLLDHLLNTPLSCTLQ